MLAPDNYPETQRSLGHATLGRESTRVYTITDNVNLKTRELCLEAILALDPTYTDILNFKGAGERIFLVGNIAQGVIYGAVTACDLAHGNRQKALQLLVPPRDRHRVTPQLATQFLSTISAYRGDTTSGPGLHIQTVHSFGEDNLVAVLDLVLATKKLEPYEVVQFGVPVASALPSYLKLHGFQASGIFSDDELYELYVFVNSHHQLKADLQDIPDYKPVSNSGELTGFTISMDRVLRLSAAAEPVNGFIPRLNYVGEIAEVCCLKQETVEELLKREPGLQQLNSQQWWECAAALSLRKQTSIEQAWHAIYEFPVLLYDAPQDTIALWLVDDLTSRNSAGSAVDQLAAFFSDLSDLPLLQNPEQFYECLASWHNTLRRQFQDYLSTEEVPIHIRNALELIFKLESTDSQHLEKYQREVVLLASLAKLLNYKHRVEDGEPIAVSLSFAGSRRTIDAFLRYQLKTINKPPRRSWQAAYQDAIENFQRSLLNEHPDLFVPPIMRYLDGTDEVATQQLKCAASIALNLKVSPSINEETTGVPDIFELPIRRFGFQELDINNSPLIPRNRPESLRPLLEVVAQRLKGERQASVCLPAEASDYAVLVGVQQYHLAIGSSLYGLPEQLWYDIVRTHPKVLHNSVDYTWTLRCLISLFEPDEQRLIELLQGSFVARRLLCEEPRELFHYWVLSRCIPGEDHASLDKLTRQRMRKLVNDTTRQVRASEMASGLNTAYQLLDERTDRFKPTLPEAVQRRLAKLIWVFERSGNTSLPLGGYSLDVLQNLDSLLSPANSQSFSDPAFDST